MPKIKKILMSNFWEKLQIDSRGTEYERKSSDSALGYFISKITS